MRKEMFAMKRKRYLSSLLIVNLPLFIFSFIALVPFVLTFVVSISDEKSVLLKGYSFTPDVFTLYAYKFVLSDGLVFNSYGVTTFVTIVGTLLSVFLCAFAGYAMSVQKLKYRNKFAMFFYIPMVFQVSLVPWYLVVTKVLLLKNNIFGLIFPILISPFNVFLLRNYFRSLPASMAESAEIDGATPFRTFISVILPLGAPIIATVTLFVALKYWNNWTLALWLVDKQELFPLQYILYRIKSLIAFMQTRTTLSSGKGTIPSETVQAATLFITIGPIILLYPFVQKYFIKGIMIGAVKG